MEDDSVGWDVMMWMDHRAKLEAEEINRVEHRVKDFVGGKVSLEMQTPKLKWIKKHRSSLLLLVLLLLLLVLLLILLN